mmetsp:Transcript_40611/g.94314  ORF Transcript_40611/g.94314 Transcript_40611/m.94314 type:complete len:205 (+) Transcript_40611:496-1110(+)
MVRRVSDMLGCNEALDMLRNLHRCEVLVVHPMEAKAVEKVLYLGLYCSEAENAFLHYQFEDRAHDLWQRLHLIAEGKHILHRPRAGLRGKLQCLVPLDNSVDSRQLPALQVAPDFIVAVLHSIVNGKQAETISPKGGTALLNQELCQLQVPCRSGKVQGRAHVVGRPLVWVCSGIQKDADAIDVTVRCAVAHEACKSWLRQAGQ